MLPERRFAAAAKVILTSLLTEFPVPIVTIEE
jgi:hypothetical protein